MKLSSFLYDDFLMQQSHQTFCLIATVKLLRIMLKNKWWPTTFHTITAEHVDGWCQKWAGVISPSVIKLINSLSQLIATVCVHKNM